MKGEWLRSNSAWPIALEHWLSLRRLGCARRQRDRIAKDQYHRTARPVEIGGYAFAPNSKFASAVANAGDAVVRALRGDTGKVFGRYWTALGVERFGRANWDTRLGPRTGNVMRRQAAA